jgi:serine/threonine-protein kinase
VRNARRTLGDPVTRSAVDAARGNVGGVSRCLAAGVPEEELARLRREFLATYPEVEARAQALFDEGMLLEAQAQRHAALSRYAQALALDPLNLALHHYHQALLRRMCAAVAAVCGAPSVQAR